MLPATIAFLATAVLLTVVVIATRWRNLRAMLPIAMALSAATATWYQCTLPILELPTNTRSVIAIVFLTLFCFHSGRLIFRGPGLLDLLMIALVVWNAVVDTWHGANLVSSAAASYAEWGIPFAAGRYAMVHRGSAQRFAPWIVGIGVVIAVLAIFESATSVNIWDVLCQIDDEVFRPTDKRYGLAYRACGPMRHPLFLASLFLFILPWAWAQYHRQDIGRQKILIAAAIM
ncbi:MAG: hypothetical protein AAFP69_08685, partial [Planctomycetota bacterium]